MFYLLKMALRNIGRNKRRTALTLSAVVIVVMLLTFAQSYLEGVINDVFANYVKTQAGHIKIVHREYAKKEIMLALDVPVEDYASIEAKLEDLEEVTLVTERLRFGVMLDVDGRTKNCLGIGAIPEKEHTIMELNEYIVDGSYFRIGASEMLMGSLLAEELGARVGDKITVVTRTAYNALSALNFKLVGLFTLGFTYIDESTFYIPLDTAQELLDMEGQTTEMFVLLTDRDDAIRVASEITSLLQDMGIADVYEALPWQSQGELFSALSSSRVMMGIITGIILLVAALAITNTMLMAVFERTQEIGTMMALGMKTLQIVQTFIWESVSIGVLGGIVGSALGTALALLVQTKGIDVSSAMGNISMPMGNVIYTDYTVWHTITAFLYGLILTALAALYPAYKASQMEPTEALRSV